MRALFLALLISMNAFADPTADKVLKESSKAAVTTGGQEMVRRFLNRKADSLPGMSGDLRLGDKLVCGVGIVLSIMDFANARNDSERALALGNGGVSILTYLNAGAGFLVGVTWFGLELISQFMEAQDAKALLDTYRRIDEYYRQVAQTDQKILNSEIVLIEQAQTRISATERDLKNASEYLRDYCFAKGQVETIGGVEHCIGMSEEAMTDLQILAGQANVILNFKSDFIDVKKAFLQMKLPTKEIEAMRNKIRELLPEYEKQIHKAKNYYVGLANQIIQNTVMNQTKIDELRDNCVATAIELRAASVEMRINRMDAIDLEKINIDTVTVPALSLKMAEFANSECVTLDEKINDPKLKTLISHFFAEFGTFKREMNI